MAMTLRLAGFQHFCARFADAFLTSLNPLTYERGDYQDLTEATDPDYELTGRDYDEALRAERIAEGRCEGCGAFFACVCTPDSGAVPPAAPATPAGVCAPSEAPPAGPPIMSLDWIEPAFYTVLNVHHAALRDDRFIYCETEEGLDHGRFEDWQEWREHCWDDLRDRLERAWKTNPPTSFNQ